MVGSDDKSCVNVLTPDELCSVAAVENRMVTCLVLQL
jgi:hypothetical protein